MARSDVPAALKDWMPWVLHGQGSALCPSPYNGDADKACVWPARLEIKATATGASFRQEVQVFGEASSVALPGEAAQWPQSVQADGHAVPVVEANGQPVVSLPPGRHVLEGSLRWAAMPQDLHLPTGLGSLALWIDGALVQRQADAQGRVWLKQAPQQAQSGDSVTVHIARLIDDQVPLNITTHYDLAISGKARDIELPLALLPGTVALHIDSALPARLQPDGTLVVQARPGHWTIDLGSRKMSPTAALSLPAAGLAASNAQEEIWSFVAHNDVRLVSVEGASAIDPKQVTMPEAWRAHPAYRMRPGDALRLVETRRGNPVPNPDSLRLSRQLWLDFDGGGYTVHDDITGTLSRSARLDMGAPAVLGRAAVDGEDQPITQLNREGGQGLEVRGGQARISADSRIDASQRTLPATGWRVDFNQAAVQLALPPGWRLIHARGVDEAEGSWVSQWTLWDFFFVLLSTLAAGRLLGWRSGAVLGAALVLSWHMNGSPHALWLLFLGLHALVKVLPVGKLRAWSLAGQWLCAALLALALLPYAVAQVRLSMYPSLERPWINLGQEAEAAARAEAGRIKPLASGDDVRPAAPAPTTAPQDNSETDDLFGSSSSDSARTSSTSKPAYKTLAVRQGERDPGAKVQTGPGLPAWQWNTHQLTWQGPVQQGQTLGLTLLPPAGTAVLRLCSLLLMVLAWWQLVRTMPRSGWPRGADAGGGAPAAAAPGSTGSSAVALAFLAALALGMGGPEQARAAEQAPPAVASPSSPVPPSPAAPLAPVAPGLLDELRERLTAAPDCLPTCADVARLQVEASGSRITLRLEVHAQADVAVPLPGQGTHWQPAVVLVNGQSAAARRDDNGGLWVAVNAGVSQVVLEGDAAQSSSVDITLPMPVREIKAQLDGWSLSGLDPRGVAQGAISLARAQSATSGQEQGTQRDALPPFVIIERTVHLGLRWTVETRISRAGPSQAPLKVRVGLLPSEAVNDDAVQVEGGVATIQMGAEASREFVSTLKEAPQLVLHSLPEPHQVEVWHLDVSTQWHATHTGLAPVMHQSEGRWWPTWQPWPDERVTVSISKPVGVSGQTLTVDRVHTTVTPGLRATDVMVQVALRSSQGGNHRLALPEGAQLLAVSVDGEVLPVQQQGRSVTVPITPGAHQLQLKWRESRGMTAWFKTAPVSLGIAGVNDALTLSVPADRVILAVGGPSVGPAVLFWGVLVVITVVAIGLGRLQITPLRAASWALLGLGVAQMSLWGMLVVVGWFLVMAARQRMGTPSRPRRFALMQVSLALWALAAAGVLLETVRVGLLGYPDMLILGNGSDRGQLNWFADRFQSDTAQAWLLSAPVWAYRVAMLLWALWLAASLLRWVRWAWSCYSAGGYWPEGLAVRAPPKS